MTPSITINVPKPLRKVIGFLKISTDNHINKARFTVFATLRKQNQMILTIKHIRNFYLCVIGEI